MIGEVIVLFVYILKISQQLSVLLAKKCNQLTCTLFCKSICRKEHGIGEEECINDAEDGRHVTENQVNDIFRSQYFEKQ